MAELIYKDEVYAIQGAVYDVYYHLGSGFLESVYQEALEREFNERRIPHIPQKELNVFYKNKELRKSFRLDFLCYGEILLELKAETRISTPVPTDELPKSKQEPLRTNNKFRKLS